ncbi:MAG TPA: ATP-binding protein [Stellaceae bacterium]|nr:ATP-binding protein [Stellaceae bacterium]
MHAAPRQAQPRTDARHASSLGAIAEFVEPVSPDTRCAEVYDRFRQTPDLIAVPVVERSRPIGLVNRHDLTMSLARDYGRALYALKPITSIMDAHPLIVESSVQTDALEWVIATEKPTALMRGFIVVEEGRYQGVGTALSLLQLNLIRTEQRNSELERARNAAESASRSKSQFLAMMSHELRTPLNAIIGFSDLMQTATFGLVSPPRYQEYIRDIHLSGLNLLAVINDILDMAKIEEGKMVLFEEEMELEEQIFLAVRFVAFRARQGGVTVEMDLQPDLPRLSADRRAVRHMLFNLLSNAVKFTPAGGRVSVSARRTADGIDFAVSDTGIGMSPEHIAIALTPFGQVANEFTRKHDGTGLGLPLVKSLAELHGATLRIESDLGTGTTARVIFPPRRIVGVRAGLAAN